MTAKFQSFGWRLALVMVVLAATLSAARVQQPAKDDDKGGPWGRAVDGLQCRLTIAPKLTVGQSIAAIIEIKNVSDKKRYIANVLEPSDTNFAWFKITGPKGNVPQASVVRHRGILPPFQAIEPGETKIIKVEDLCQFFGDLHPWDYRLRKPTEVTSGKYAVEFRFRSPKMPDRFKETPAGAELLAGVWAGEIDAAPVSFQLLPLAKDDLVVHEWGVFTVINNAKYANAHQKEEWGAMPTFFYRQFPTERLHWIPSAWDKPIVYFYAKPTPLQLRVKVTFTEGAPVVWWPAAAEPEDNSPGPQLVEKPKPFRTLVWHTWIGGVAPVAIPGVIDRNRPTPWGKVNDYPLPPDCWLQHARLREASRVSVIGTSLIGARAPGGKLQTETESFIYYDGLVPAPDYLHCEQTDPTAVTLRNGAKFDLQKVFVIDRRVKGKTAFAYLDGVKEPFKSGATLSIKPHPVAAKDWPAAGVKQMRQALLDAGLYEPEADSVLKIWQKRLLESDGLVAFHILPVSEYDRMLPLDIVPAPPTKPIRVGIAFHPNLEIEPKLRERVKALLHDLDDEKFQKREAATKALLEIGPVAIGMLRAELAKNPSLEMKRRMEDVINRVDATEWLSVPASIQKKEGK